MKSELGWYVVPLLVRFQPAIQQSLDDGSKHEKEGIKQFVGKEFANHTVINQVYKSGIMVVLTVVGSPISEKLETIRQKTSLLRYSICSIENQVHNSTKIR